jgi:thioredoxin 1
LALRDVKERDWDAVVLRSSEPVLVKFWAPWCPWSKKMMTLFEHLSKLYEGRLRFARVNVEEEGDLMSRYGVKSVPTLKLFWNGRPVGEIVGYQNGDMLKREIDLLLEAARVGIAQSSSLV